MKLTVSKAAEVALQQTLATKSTSPEAGLRLGVRKGGCAGWQYTMQIGEPESNDLKVEECLAPVYIAADSLDMLSGCHLDYSDALSDAGFKITNPNASRSCGCGTSFESNDDENDETYDPSRDGLDCKSTD